MEHILVFLVSDEFLEKAGIKEDVEEAGTFPEFLLLYAFCLVRHVPQLMSRDEN
jgi:hypothetical protein